MISVGDVPPAGLELPPETNPADWILDMTVSSQTVRDGETLVDAYKQCKAKPFAVRRARRLWGGGKPVTAWPGTQANTGAFHENGGDSG